MATMKKIAGVIAGLSAVAVVGVAVAQNVPPNRVTDPSLDNGHMNSLIIGISENGVPNPYERIGSAQVAVVQENVAVVETVPAPVVSESTTITTTDSTMTATAPVQESQSMGAAPAPVSETTTSTTSVSETPAPMVAKADRG